MSENERELASNRKAYHNFEILETIEAGILLLGTEIKSLRNHGGNLAEGYVKILGNAAYLMNASIQPYKFGNIHNHEERRERKLLLHKRELAHLDSAASQKGLTIIPLSFYLKKGKVKVKIGLAKGKKHHDKRESIKKRDVEREMKKFV